MNLKIDKLVVSTWPLLIHSWMSETLDHHLFLSCFPLKVTQLKVIQVEDDHGYSYRVSFANLYNP